MRSPGPPARAGRSTSPGASPGAAADAPRMKGLRITRWGGPLEPFEADDPQPGPGELQVRVEACGIGLTVVNYTSGQYAEQPLARPVVPGHELVGTVSAL